MTWRCTRTPWAQFSCPPSWVERGMSGEVWLIFMEESGQGLGGSRKPSLFSCSLVSVSVLRGSWLLSLLPENRPLSRHGTQQSFQDTKRDTPKRARPQAVTTRVSRLTEISAKKQRSKVSMTAPQLRAHPLHSTDRKTLSSIYPSGAGFGRPGWGCHWVT